MINPSYRWNRLPSCLIRLLFLCLSLLLSACTMVKSGVEIYRLNEDALGLYNQGLYLEAIPKLERALKIADKEFGPDNPTSAKLMRHLGLSYYRIGEYAKAKPMQLKALAIRERQRGRDHPQVGQLLNELAESNKMLGNLSRSEALHLRALDIHEKEFGRDSVKVAMSLNNLAGVYVATHDYPKAEELYRRSLGNLSGSGVGAERAAVMTSLGKLYLHQERHGDAAKILNRALSLGEDRLGPMHPSVAITTNNLAVAYLGLGELKKAERLHRRALAVREERLGKENIEVAQSLLNLAAVLYLRGDRPNTMTMLKRADAIYSKVLGERHHLLAETRAGIALVQAAAGEYAQAGELFHQVLEIEADLINEVMGFAPEEQRLDFIAAQNRFLHSFLSLVNQHLSDNPKAVRAAMDIWLQRKGIILESSRRFQEALVYAQDQKGRELLQQLAGVRAGISRLVFAGPGGSNPASYRRQIKELEAEEKRLESQLMAHSKAYALQQQAAKADVARIAEGLPKGSVLIDFAQVNGVDFTETKWRPAHVAAFVIRAGDAQPAMLDLGPVAEIKTQIDSYRRLMQKPSRHNAERIATLAKRLHRQLFLPLLGELGGATELFISPDGPLNRLPFELLQKANGRYLIEDYSFNYLNAGRDLLRFKRSEAAGKGVLLMGDPDFDLGPDQRQGVLRQLQLASDDKVSPTRATQMQRAGFFNFSPLPGTREEVLGIQSVLNKGEVAFYLGDQALEEVLLSTDAPRIIHLATHGFFLEDQIQAAGFEEQGLVPLSGQAGVRPASFDDPLLRSGIVLAGANASLQQKDQGTSDGIVTAEKILGLNLQGTELVVLSACDTGLGEVRTGEGVFGLRRAFIQAGAKSMVMSLWPVPDKETKELMLGFYRNLDSGSFSRAQALREAMLEQKRVVERRYGYDHPAFWGGFVFLGEP